MSKFNKENRKQIRELVLKLANKMIIKRVKIEEKDIVIIVKERLGFDITPQYVNYIKQGGKSF